MKVLLVRIVLSFGNLRWMLTYSARVGQGKVCYPLFRRTLMINIV